MSEVKPATVEFSTVANDAGTQLLNWKCEHLSVFSGLHTFAPEASPELVEQTQADLLAYWQTIATCGCSPPTISP